MGKITNAFTSLPDFDAVSPETVITELDRILSDNLAQIDALTRIENPDWDNFVYPLDLLSDRLDRFWSPVRHLNAVMNNEPLRQAYNEGVGKISDYSTSVAQNSALYAQFQRLAEPAVYDGLCAAQQKVIDDNLRSFRLSGVSLDEDKKRRYKEIAAELSKLMNQVSDNVLDTTNAWQHIVTDEAALSGLPAHTVEAARNKAVEQDKQGWLFGLDMPTYIAVLTYAENPVLREALYTAWNTRASDQGGHDPQKDNAKLMEQILALRAEKAALLGFENYAALSVETKMVESTDQVMSFLQELADKSLPAAKADMADLRSFAAEQGHQGELQAWDIAYYSNKLKEARFSISDEDLKPYFPADVVVPGLFSVVGKLFGLKIQAHPEVKTWHPDACFYSIEDRDGNVRGGFYLDPYARKNKRGGAWMDECISRMAHKDGVQLPVAYLTCNSTPPVGDKPALLTHNEVITLFHEFGHGLHHMLTRVDYRDVSGINGVEWDAVELPSQFLENWCWEEEGLRLISRHYETGETLPADLLEKARNAKNFQAAMQMVRQLEFAMFDMQIHLAGPEAQPVDIQAELDDVRSRVTVVPVPAFNRFQNSFTHIFAGGYAAGYFSYKWAEVLSADAFSRFEEEGVFNTATGEDFLRKILEKGGSQKALELFVDFRGREPELEPLLRHSGLAA
ncbi:M3 family metallopeptidase [Granulosicoccaceae sp. 1_MG-2023]|nr:M3 family metallopeptidase [Granulosicoccaceae sp. 1_MG-2023]